MSSSFRRKKWIHVRVRIFRWINPLKTLYLVNIISLHDARFPYEVKLLNPRDFFDYLDTRTFISLAKTQIRFRKKNC